MNFKIAISYSGADRNRVLPIAKALARRFTKDKVFYDRFHAAFLTGHNATKKLDKIYRSDAELVVVFLSQSYVDRLWTGHEWGVLQDLLFEQVRAGDILVFRDSNVGKVNGWGPRDIHANFDDASVRSITIAPPEGRRISRWKADSIWLSIWKRVKRGTGSW